MTTRIILEIGCNHNGDPDLARRMIDNAARLGVWAVKFQKRDPESLPEGTKYIPRRPENSFGNNLYEHRKALEFSIGTLKDLLIYAHNLGLAAGVSVFDMVSAEQMKALPWDFIKLPSQLYTNYELTRCLVGGEYLFIASTGMHVVDEVLEWQYFGRHDVTMYCRSIYPATMASVEFSAMRRIRDELIRSSSSSVLGYSSHDEGGKAIPLAVLEGAEYIERHYTLDKTMKGSDHSTVSSDFAEMEAIIQAVNDAEAMLGSGDFLSEDELKVRKVYRGF